MIINQLRTAASTRRVFVTAAAGVVAANALPLPALAGSMPVPAPAPGAAARAVGGLTLLPPGETPYDAAARRDLAADALTYLVRQQGNFPGRSVYQLPSAPWFGGYELPTSERSWDMTVPGSLPIYLLAGASDTGRLDPSLTTITVNGEPVGDLGPYVHSGVNALSYGTPREFAALSLVFAPPAPGRYKLVVQSRLAPPTPGSPEGDTFLKIVQNKQPSPPSTTTLTYDIRVGGPAAIGPVLLRDPSGTLYGTVGADLRRIPDAETARAMGLDTAPTLAASPDFIAAFGNVTDLPVLRDGQLVQSPGSAIFRLQGGTRVWIKRRESINPDDVRTVDVTVLQSIPPALQDDMLLKGAAPDVFHVDGGTMRKIPDWDWAQKKSLDPADLIYVPDRIIGTLPQNSPEWRLPGGTIQDRSFYSPFLGRAMPYRVYLPAGYDSPDRAGQRYPVLYLLHGVSGRYDEWDGYGVSEVANALYYDGKFPAAIMIMPQGGLGYWANQEGGTPWSDYVARDVVQFVDQNYRTIPKREARAIGGLSMGAHGALQIALNFPEIFGIAGAHSPSIRDETSAPIYFGTGGAFARHDPISLVRNGAFSQPLQFWIDAGQNDSWRAGAELLHKALTEKGVAHEWHVYSGEHDGWYWGDHMWEYLPYYAKAFQKNALPLTFK